MIGSLRGRLLARQAGAELLVEVQGIGYRVQVTPTVAAAAGVLGEETFLYVHHAVREDAETLYGFATLDERVTFEALIGARGVGPALALAVLGVHQPDALRRVVAVDDVEQLCLVPGVGPKTAVRLLVELKTRLALPPAETPPVSTASGAAPPPGADVRADVRAALDGLGYGAEEIRATLAEIPEPEHGADASQMLREALRRLAGPR